VITAPIAQSVKTHRRKTPNECFSRDSTVHHLRPSKTIPVHTNLIHKFQKLKDIAVKNPGAILHKI
jgi:hypothetical protein